MPNSSSTLADQASYPRLYRAVEQLVNQAVQREAVVWARRGIVVQPERRALQDPQVQLALQAHRDQ